MSALDQGLAHFRRLIISKWGNQNDNTATYVFPDGARLRLTPIMVRAWARAIVSNFHVFHSIMLIDIKV